MSSVPRPTPGHDPDGGPLGPEAELDVLLARARLRVEPDEYARLVRTYEQQRAQLEALRLPEARDAEPAMRFDPGGDRL